jgi:hypothetical protein
MYYTLEVYNMFHPLSGTVHVLLTEPLICKLQATQTLADVMKEQVS